MIALLRHLISIVASWLFLSLMAVPVFAQLTPELSIPADAQSKIVPTDQASDVRVIIDISGSMRQNDPENLRIPALNLIVEMLPEGAQAGVWTFGQWVNMLIPPGKVNDAWRANAKEKARSINSHGLRTNIGEAMEKATWKFANDSAFDQHVILLTDGLVDIAPESDPNQQSKNEAERQRLLSDILTEYKNLGVKIHSIALSDNADKTMLEKLSVETGGLVEVVNNSQELVKAFLKAFEKAAPQVAEQVPLSQENTFDIDATVEEFTALVFRKEGSLPTQLVSPSGTVISQIKAHESASWFSESVYDLVTITTPQAGTWKIEAELDPDNQVTVISDLKMEILNLPSTLFPGQQVDFEVYLHEDGQVITQADFLKLMTVEMTMTAESGRSGSKVISDPDNVPADGRYRESIKRLSKEGQYELQVEVDGKTFKRLRKEYIQVRQPIGFEIRKRMVEGQEAYAVRVIPQVPEVEVARTRVIAKLKGPDQTSIIQAMPWNEEGVWEAIITADKGPGAYQIAMNVKGLIEPDQEFRIKPDPIDLVFPIPADFSHEYFVKEEMSAEQALMEEGMAKDAQAQEQMQQAPEEAVMPDLAAKMAEQETQVEEPSAPEAEEKTAEESAEVTDESEEAEDGAPEPVPMWLYILIPLLTLVLGIGGFFVYRKMAAKKQPQFDQPTKEDGGMKTPEVSLNDGMDDEEFDEDFDLSDSDGDEDLSMPGGDLDDLDNLDLSSDEDSGLDDLPELDDVADSPPPEPVADDIPDFDENFDIDVSDEDAPPQQEPIIEEDTAAAIDELDSVLDSLTDDDDIPQLDESPAEEIAAEPASEPASPSEADEEKGEAAIDEALANLESELDDIDVDALVDEGPAEDEADKPT